MNSLDKYKMKPDEFEAALKAAIDFGERRIGQDADDEAIPYLFIYHRNEEGDKLGEIQVTMCALAVELSSAGDRRNIMRSFGAKCYANRQMPVAIFFVSEAYVSRQDPKAAKPIQPIDDPNAQECMLVIAMAVGVQDAVMVRIPLERDDNGLFQRSAPNAVARDAKSPLLISFWLGFAAAAMEPPEDEEGEEWKKG